MVATDTSSLTSNVLSSPPAMASDLADRINRLTLARTKLEKELEIIHECILEAIEKKTVKSKKWPQSCEESMDIAVSKNEETSF